MCWRLERIQTIARIISIVGRDTIAECFTHEIEGVVGIARYGSSSLSYACETILIVVDICEISAIWSMYSELVPHRIIRVGTCLAATRFTHEIAESIIGIARLIVVRIVGRCEVTERIIDISLIGHSSYSWSKSIVLSRDTIEVVVGVGRDSTIRIRLRMDISSCVVGIARLVAIRKKLLCELVIGIVSVGCSIVVCVRETREIAHRVIGLRDSLPCSCLCFHLSTIIIGIVCWYTTWVSDSDYLSELVVDISRSITISIECRYFSIIFIICCPSRDDFIPVFYLCFYEVAVGIIEILRYEPIRKSRELQSTECIIGRSGSMTIGISFCEEIVPCIIGVECIS